MEHLLHKKISQENYQNFGAFIRKLGELSHSPQQENASLFWFYSKLPNGVYNFIWGKDKDFCKTDLKNCLTDFQNTPFYFCTGFTSKNEINRKLLKDFSVKFLGAIDGVYFDLHHNLPETNPPENLTIKTPQTPEDYKIFAQTMAELEGSSAEIGPQFYNNFEAYQAQKQITALTAFIDNKPVGCSMLFIDDQKIAGNYTDAVHKNYRNSGINSAMVLERLRIAKKAGCSKLIAQCMDTSTRLYQKLGFQKTCEIDLYGQ